MEGRKKSLPGFGFQKLSPQGNGEGSGQKQDLGGRKGALSSPEKVPRSWSVSLSLDRVGALSSLKQGLVGAHRLPPHACFLLV